MEVPKNKSQEHLLIDSSHKLAKTSADTGVLQFTDDLQMQDELTSSLLPAFCSSNETFHTSLGVAPPNEKRVRDLEVNRKNVINSN